LGKIHLVTEWVTGGELFTRITEQGSLNEKRASLIFYQLLLAVQHLVFKLPSACKIFKCCHKSRAAFDLEKSILRASVHLFRRFSSFFLVDSTASVTYTGI
jgi:serine/threonine protein kinase